MDLLLGQQFDNKAINCEKCAGMVASHTQAGCVNHIFMSSKGVAKFKASRSFAVPSTIALGTAITDDSGCVLSLYLSMSECGNLLD